MLFTLKALLLSSAFLTHDDMVLRDRVNMFLPKSTPQTEMYNKAAQLTAKSSYADLIEHDEQHAMQLLQEACKLGYGRACWYYAYTTHKEEDIRHAQDVLTKSCFASNANAYNGESCTFLGIMLSQGKVEIEQSERELYERACNLRDGWGCYRLAYDFIASEDNDMEQAKQIGEMALTILSESCKNGNAGSCYFAGSIYEDPLDGGNGWLSEEKYMNMHYFYQQGCKLGDGDSCAASAKLDE